MEFEWPKVFSAVQDSPQSIQLWSQWSQFLLGYSILLVSFLFFCITVIFIFHDFFCPQGRYGYFNFFLWFSVIVTSICRQVLFFFLLSTKHCLVWRRDWLKYLLLLSGLLFKYWTDLSLLVNYNKILTSSLDWLIRFYLKIKEELHVFFSRTDSGMCIIHWSIRLKSSRLHCSRWIIISTKSCLLMYSSCASFIMYLIVSLSFFLSLSLSISHFLFLKISYTCYSSNYYYYYYYNAHDILNYFDYYVSNIDYI